MMRASPLLLGAACFFLAGAAPPVDLQPGGPATAAAKPQ